MMNRLNNYIFIALVTLLGFPDVAQSQLLNRYIQQACDTLTTILPVTPDCACKGQFSAARGVNFNVSCSFEEPICLVPANSTLCGTPSINGMYYRRSIPSTTKLSFDMDALFGLAIANPKPLTVELTHNTPIQLLTNPISFKSCKMFAGDKQCTSCTICNVDKGFKFDCTNVGLIPTGGTTGLIPGFITGILDGVVTFPKIEQCIGIPSATSVLP